MKIDGTKTHFAVASVVVNGQVDESLIASAGYEAMDEFREKGAVANLALNVINALLCQVNLAHKQVKLPSSMRSTGEKNGSMLVVVPRKEVTDHDVEIFGVPFADDNVLSSQVLQKSEYFQNLCPHLLHAALGRGIAS